MLDRKNNNNSKIIYYLMLFSVIIMWGIDPIVNTVQYKTYSPLALSLINTFFAALLFFVVCIKRLRFINKKFLKIAIPIGALNSLGCILQRIGLLMTTPASYAFLEHLSCAFVPIALYVITKKRPTLLQFGVIASCLIGCFVISGLLGGGISFKVGDALCAISGVTFGFSIALMSTHLKNADILLYTLFQFISYFILSLILAIILNNIKINGSPIEEFRFSFDIRFLIFAIAFGIVDVGVGWLLRNIAVSKLSPIFIAVTSPLSAVISATVSIIFKYDVFTITLLIGALLITASAIVSGVHDAKRKL